MFDVAFSLLICCSLVCKAILKALLPWLSLDTPMILPGIFLLNSSVVAKKAACGPPYPKGTPNLCAFPTAASAFISPGVFNMLRARRSVAKQVYIFLFFASFINSV